MSIVLDGTAGITTPEITSAGGPLVVNASAPDNSVVVNASGNVGVGTSSPGANLEVLGNSAAVKINESGGGDLRLSVTGSTTRINAFSNHPLLFSTNNTERMRIDSSGNLLVGRTSVVGSERAIIQAASVSTGLAIRMANSSGTYNAIDFYDGDSTLCGSVAVNNSGNTTAYVTSSDYRLKENVQPMTGAMEKVAALKPCTYTWKNSGIAGQGFIAHELQEVCPDAVVGEKDAANEDGSIKPQGIDTSFLVATLTAAIQEQQAIITAQQAALESLTARVVALETQP